MNLATCFYQKYLLPKEIEPYPDSLNASPPCTQKNINVSFNSNNMIRFEYISKGNLIQGKAQLAFKNWKNLFGDQREGSRQLNKFRCMLFTMMKTNCCIFLSCLPSGLQSFLTEMNNGEYQKINCLLIDPRIISQSLQLTHVNKKLK